MKGSVTFVTCSVLDLAVTDPQTKIYTLSDLQNLVTNMELVRANYAIQWNAYDRKYSNFSITTIAANEDAKTFSAWLASFGSVSIQHCFDGKVIKNEANEAIIEVSKVYIYIRDGFDFAGKNQPLGEWENDIFLSKKPNIAASSWIYREAKNNDLYLTNSKLNDFRVRHNIGSDFKLLLKPISANKLFNRIIINKNTHEIIYQK